MNAMKKTANFWLALMVAGSFTACNENLIDYSSNDNSNVQAESNADSHLEDASDMASLAVAADPGTLTGGRSDGYAQGARSIKDLISDARLACAEVTLEFADDNIPGGPGVVAVPHGFITIDFGTGCEGPAKKVRKGKIVIEFKGRRFLPGSFISITFVDFSINGIKVEGNRKETNISENILSSVKFNIVESDLKVTFLDGTFETRAGNRIREWDRAASPTGDIWLLYNGSSSEPAAAGVNRRGIGYVVNITKKLVFKRSCAVNSGIVIPVEGIKELITDKKKIVIDFGNGECDRKVVVTINGKSKDVDLGD